MKVGDLVINLFRRDVPGYHPIQNDPLYVDAMDRFLWGEITERTPTGCFIVVDLSSKISWNFHPSWIAPFSPENLDHLTEQQLLELLKHSLDIKNAS